MKSYIIATLPTLAAAGAWWDGAPSCASSCLSSAWSTSAWPAPTDFCDTASQAPLESCLSSGCASATDSGLASYSSISSSLCSRYASCTSAGSTGVLTLTVTAPAAWSTHSHDGDHGRGGWGGGGGGRGGHGWDTSDWPSDWASGWPSGSSTGVLTVTGCSWDGSPWVVAGGGGRGGGWGWGGDGWNGGGPGGPWAGSFWGSSKSGWAYRTSTATVTTTYTANDTVITATGLATVHQAASGSVTSTTTYFDAAEATGETTNAAGSTVTGVLTTTSSDSAANGPLRLLNGPARAGDWTAVKVLGSVLGGTLAVVLML